MEYCDAKISSKGIMGGGDHKCREEIDHKESHKCTCGFTWDNDKIPMIPWKTAGHPVKLILFALAQMMDSNLSMYQAVKIVNEEIDNLGLTQEVPNVTNGSKIIKAIGDRLGYEFDVEEPMSQEINDNF